MQAKKERALWPSSSKHLRHGRQAPGGLENEEEEEEQGSPSCEESLAPSLPALKGGLAIVPGHLREALAGRRRFLFLIFTGMAHPGFNSGPSCLCAFPAESNYTGCFFFFLIEQ